MKVADLMTREVFSCRPSDSMDRAARIMWEKDCGIVPVVDEEGRILGMISDRDVCMATYMRGHGPADMMVVHAMSGGVRSCRPDDDVPSALREMAEHRLRRLPVLDADDRPIGLLSIADVCQAAGRKTLRGRKALADGALDALVEVTRPRIAEAPAKSSRRSSTKPSSKRSSESRTGKGETGTARAKPKAARARKKSSKRQ